MIDIAPDPRISNMRPAWLTDDEQWREQLQAMSREDAAWIERHWEMAGGAKPAVDTSWITFETIRDPWWPIIGIPVGLTALGLVLSWVVVR